MLVFFFFKQKTAYEMRISDWSSDVCSSDLLDRGRLLRSLPVSAERRGGRSLPAARFHNPRTPARAVSHRHSGRRGGASSAATIGLASAPARHGSFRE